MHNHTAYIKTKLEVEGFHYWADAPEEVKFLRANHRHIFIITAIYKVNHCDRDLEFFLLRDKTKKALDYLYTKDLVTGGILFKGRSCETIALDLQRILKHLQPLEIEVSEDGENSAILKFDY